MEESVRKKVTERREKSTALVPINYVVPEEQKKLALAKYDLIKNWDKFRNEKTNKTQAGKDFLDAYNNNCLCKNLFVTIGKVAIGTIYEWHKKLREYNDDWHSLINNYTFGAKTTKTLLNEAEKSELLKNLLHPNQLNIGKAIKYTKMALKGKGYENLCCDLTYRRFANNYKAEHYDVWVEAREGNKALHDKVLPYITRDVSKLEVGDVIIGDGHRLAFFVKNPYTGNPVRPTLVAYQDWKSGGFVGFEIMLEENTQCIASALRNSIINLGKVPRFVYQDNGKAFKAKYFTEDGIAGLFKNLGIQAIRGYVDYSDIFMIRYGTPGIISRNFKGVIANNLFKISSKNNNVTDNYLFQFFNSDNMQNYLTRNAVSSTMPAINFSTLYRQEIIIPSNDIMLKFTKLDETIRKQSLNIKREIQLLLSIRKNVLSKLMLENSDSSTAKLSFSVHFIIYLMQIKSMNFSGNLCYFFCFLMLINNKLSFLVLLTMPLNKSFPKHFKVMFFKSIMMQSHFFNA